MGNGLTSEVARAVDQLAEALSVELESHSGAGGASHA